MSSDKEPIHNSAEHLRPGSESLESRLESLHEEMRRQSVSPFGGDEYIGAFFNEALDLTADNEDFIGIINHYMTKRNEINHGPYAALLLFRIFHHHARINDTAYPNESYLNEGNWGKKITQLLSDENIRTDILEDLETKRLQSNKESRAWGLLLPLFGLINNERFERPPRILEVGTGRMHLLKMIKMGGWVPGLEYENVMVLNEQYKENHNATRLINRIADKQLNIGECLGIDIVPIAETEHKDRVYSDSFSPKELIDIKSPVNVPRGEIPLSVFTAKRRDNNYWLLDYATPPDLTFAKMDFLNSSQAEFLKPWEFDIILFSSVMYQHSQEDRERDIEFAKNLINENGLIIIQDDVKVDEDAPNVAHFYESWSNDWQYHTLGIDMHNPDEIQNLIEWQTNLCKTMRFGLGRLAVGNAFKTLPELLGTDSD